MRTDRKTEGCYSKLKVPNWDFHTRSDLWLCSGDSEEQLSLNLLLNDGLRLSAGNNRLHSQFEMWGVRVDSSSAISCSTATTEP